MHERPNDEKDMRNGNDGRTDAAEGLRAAADAEYLAIRDGVGLDGFAGCVRDRSLSQLRLPLNNPDACRYLRWVNDHFAEETTFLNFLLNVWDCKLPDGRRVRPPTPNEYAVFCSKRIVETASDERLAEADRTVDVDLQARFISDAYYFCTYSRWLSSGLAGCIAKWGTFEDNLKEGDEFATIEKDW